MSAPPHTRPRFSRLAALAMFLLGAGVVALAQPPKEEEDPKAAVKKKVKVEEEDGKGTVKKKVTVDDPPDVKKAPAAPPPPPPGGPPDVRLDELVRAAQDTKIQALKDLFTRYSVPFDRLTEAKGGAVRIKPIPLFRTDRFPAQFGVTELGADGQPRETRQANGADVKKIEYYEELAFADVEALLKQKPLGSAPGPDGLTPDEQLAAAEKVLAAALRYHDYARERNLRRGKAWDEVRRPVFDRLREVRLRQLQRAVTTSDWARVRSVGTVLLTNYPNDAAIAKEVGAARVAEAELLMKSDKHIDHVKAKELLDEFEAKFPGAGGEAARRVRVELSREATRLFEQARGKKAAGDLVTARDAVVLAAALDPTIPGLRELQRDLNVGYASITVAVRQFPEKMSPATARFDSEKQAVELLFEGFLEEVPDPTNGSRFRTGVALLPPGIVPGGRDVFLRTRDPGPNGRDGFDAHDVVGTLKLLRSRPELWAASSLPWFEDLPVPRDSSLVLLNFRHGHPDPRTLLTFKLLPAGWLLGQNKPVDDAEFAAKPFGTGPFRINSITPPGSELAREVVFIANTGFGNKTNEKDRTGQPFLKEVRMIEAAKITDPVGEFRAGRLHILPDVPTADVLKFTSPASGLIGKVSVVKAETNRRVHMLAMNHRRPPFQNVNLRKGLSEVIDREEILTAVFRANTDFHKALTGPFPPASWATARGPAGQTTPLLDRNLGLVHLREYLAAPGSKPELTLSYPTGDPLAQAACERIKAQVEAVFRDAQPGKKVVITLDPLPPRELIRRVEEEHRFDLAYVPFDYPDDWVPFGLGLLLDPTAAGRGGRNFLGFGSPESNPGQAETSLVRELIELRAHRDFGEVSTRTARVHKQFNDLMPFVPLWQLDRHTVFSTSLKVYVDDGTEPAPPRVLNPTTLFNGVARWRVDG